MTDAYQEAICRLPAHQAEALLLTFGIRPPMDLATMSEQELREIQHRYGGGHDAEAICELLNCDRATFDRDYADAMETLRHDPAMRAAATEDGFMVAPTFALRSPQDPSPDLASALTRRA